MNYEIEDKKERTTEKQKEITKKEKRQSRHSPLKV